MSISLPKGETNKGVNLWSDVYGNDKALKDGVETLESKFPVARSNLAAESKPATWYSAKVITTEETRESTSFGKLTTPDEIGSVLLPENGLIFVSFTAQVKTSNEVGGGRAAIFLGATQSKGVGGGTAESANLANTSFQTVISNGTSTSNMSIVAEAGTVATTGMAASFFIPIFATASTYTVSIQVKKETSGSITLKNRRLHVYTMGF